MSSSNTTIPEWEKLRTDESRRLEAVLREHFQSANVYRYNSASLRVRVIDPKFKGLSREQRDDLVEPVLSSLDENTQGDIMNLVLLYPGEERDSFRAHIFNAEFEHPSESML